jgi:antitoxin FitA
MRQLIARVDDRLHAAVKERARREGVSVNTLVNRLLARAVEADDRGRELERKIAAAGLTVRVTPRSIAPPRDEVIAMTRGSGTSVSEALEWTRGED